MATQAQINANRINAQKSTGPKTPEGRETVRLNGLKHGLASDILVLPGENLSDFENLLDSLEAEHQPSTATEVILVRQMAMASWRLQRLVHMEAAYYRLRRSGLEVHFKDYYTDLTEPDRQAIIAERDSSHTLINFSRYEARLERSFHKSLTALHRLRAQRKSQITDQSQSQEIPNSVAVHGTVVKATEHPQIVVPPSTSPQHQPTRGPHTEPGQVFIGQKPWLERPPAACIFPRFRSTS